MGDKMNKKLKDVYFFSIIFLVIDQAIKFYLSGKMVLNQSTIIVKDFLNITYVHNTGAAFSLFEGNTWLLIGIGVIAFIGLSIYISKLVEISDFDMFNFSLLLGGLLCNLVDRIIHGYVIDYISLNIFGYNATIFNFADICIVVSIIFMLISMIKGDLWKE